MQLNETECVLTKYPKNIIAIFVQDDFIGALITKKLPLHLQGHLKRHQEYGRKNTPLSVQIVHP